MSLSGRRLLSREEFELIKTKPKAKIVAVLEQFVARPAGKPKTGEALSGAERARRYRLNKKTR